MGKSLLQASIRTFSAWRQKRVASPLLPAAYRQLFAQNPVPMFVFDAGSLNVLEVNAAAAKEYGLSREALLAMSVKDLLGLASLDLEAGRPVTVQRRRPAGSRSEREVTTRLLHGTARPLGLGVASNVTQRKAAETLLRSVNERLVLSGLHEQSARDDAESANAVKDEFLAVMSHELRTPLQAMLGWMALLRSGRLDAADAAHGLDVIERNTRIQAQLVADLLDVSRAARGKLRLEPRSLDLRAFVATVTSSVRLEAERRGILLEVEAEGRPVVVRGDPIRLEQVVVNLLSNALKFTPRGGAIRVGVNADSAGAHLRVTDTGEGFEPGFMPMMFDSFSQEDPASTRAHGGLGLGLMIVRHLVEAHGGRVSAESAGKGRGATFIVDLPLSEGARLEGPAAAPSVPLAPDSARAQGLLAGVRALVVDDHADSREFVSIALRRSGAEVAEAGSARGALALLSAEYFDIVVSDLAMPGIDGYALLRSLRQADGPARDVPVVALSAFAAAEDRERALGAGFHAYAAKPIDPGELVKLVARAAGRITA